MHMPSYYIVEKVDKANGVIKLVIKDIDTDEVITVKLRGDKYEKVKSLISTSNSDEWYYIYSFNIVLKNGCIGDPIYLCHRNTETKIDWDGNLEYQLCSIEFATLKQIYEYDEINEGMM